MRGYCRMLDFGNDPVADEKPPAHSTRSVVFDRAGTRSTMSGARDREIERPTKKAVQLADGLLSCQDFLPRSTVYHRARKRR